MKNILWCCICFFIACNTSQKTVNETNNNSTTEIIEIASSITETELKEHLYTYASDAFEGRETGKPGQKKAIEYLKEEYQKLGIPAAKKDGNYFQEVPLALNNVPSGLLKYKNKEYSIGDHVLTFSGSNQDFSTITYVGFGIKEEGYSDYENINVKGKIILIKSGEPKDKNGNYIISGTQEKSIWSNMSESLEKRVNTAKEQGAAGIIYYDAVNFSRYQSRFNYMRQNKSGRMKIDNNVEDNFVNILIDSYLANILVPDIEKNHTVSEINNVISLQINSSENSITSENVVAVIKGTEKPEEYVVISSHLDHIGISKNGEINNGADDDGSGTVALLEIAEAFKLASDEGYGSKRSIIFLHVTGEEKGLLGSQYYTDIDPIFPLKNTVTNLNIDMIGRIDPKRKGNQNYLYLIGSDKLSMDLHNLSEEVNSKYTNIELDYTYNDPNDPNRFYYRSDHYNFAKNNIPIIFYFNGTHEDYHKPTDTPDKINYDLLENRTRLIFHTAWEIANREQRIVVD